MFHNFFSHLARFLSVCNIVVELGEFVVIATNYFCGKTKDNVNNISELLKHHPYKENFSKDTKLCPSYLKDIERIKNFVALGFYWGSWATAKLSLAGIPWKVGVSPYPSTGIKTRVFGNNKDTMLNNISMLFLLFPGGNEADNLIPDHP